MKRVEETRAKEARMSRDAPRHNNELREQREIRASRNALNPSLPTRFQRDFPHSASRECSPRKLRRFVLIPYAAAVSSDLIYLASANLHREKSPAIRTAARVSASLVFVAERSRRSLIPMLTSGSGPSSLAYIPPSSPSPSPSPEFLGLGCVMLCGHAAAVICRSNMQMPCRALNYKSNSRVKNIACERRVADERRGMRAIASRPDYACRLIFKFTYWQPADAFRYRLHYETGNLQPKGDINDSSSFVDASTARARARGDYYR
jgi:hypothetical protein